MRLETEAEVVRCHPVVARTSAARPQLCPPRGWHVPLKAALEFALAIVLLVLTAPLALLAALFVKLTSPGPILYTQTRVGRYGRPYTIYKIRTMRHNCESETGPKWATPNDPRITRVGRFLRATHIDELPQLWNVLRGEMGLVGPRPERPEFVVLLEQSIPFYRDRLLVRPGITGLAQVCLTPDTDLASVRRKLKYDLYYVLRSGPGTDLRVLVCTLLSCMGAPYWFTRRLVPSERAISAVFENSTSQAVMTGQLEPA
jgi:lipopolysaccharide/colanic/teichoic acid biosynthesis glycosyltransferase